MRKLRLMLIGLLAVAISFSCNKRADLTAVVQNNISAITKSTTAPTAIENLGAPFKTSNVLWQLNPLYPNNSPLLVTHPNAANGYEMILIDNGATNGNTPINAFHFISANLDNGSYKLVKIMNVADGSEVINSVGRVVRYTFGKNKKLYVVTEGSYGGGGHVIEYDPNTQTAWDLGKPFYTNGKYLDIYSLNVGSDGTLYGGSFGGSGEVFTFRYNYSGQFDVDKTALDNESRYVSYISGDDKFTYASCGENNWYLYAIDKATGHKTTLLSNAGPDNRIELNTYTDAPYAHMAATHYLLKDGSVTSLGAYNTPATQQLWYTYYSLNQIAAFTISWNGYEKKINYNIGNGNNQMVIYDVTSDTHPTGAAVWMNNKLYTGAFNFPLFGSYDDQNKMNVLGNTGIDIYSVAAAPTNDRVYIGAYPKGNLLEYNANLPWTLKGENIANYTFQALQTTNPKVLAREQDADASGVSGPMYLSSIVTDKSGTVISAGDNDRITTSSGRQLAISSFENGQVKSFTSNEFSQYQFSGMCLSADGTNAIIAASASAGGNGNIYVYNATSNSIISSKPFPGSNPGSIVMFDKNTIAGTYDDVIYLYDINTGNVIWKQTLGGGQRIYSITKAPDNSLCIIHMYLQSTHFKVMRFDIKVNGSNITANSGSLGEINDDDNYEASKPQYLTFGTSSSIQNTYDLYITGLKSVYRIKNCIKL
ncbi:MAG: PQQ-binding-like beta-propeller repeat protein [Bacteroidota bacterium]|nr:PQQ-binding-like beta-propeller repeat protein [Bacteroidota bacterium]